MTTVPPPVSSANAQPELPDHLDVVPHINMKLILGTFALLAILGGAAWFARGYFVRHNVEMYLIQARKAEEQGKPDEALQYYSQYLEFGRGIGQNERATQGRRLEALNRIAALVAEQPASRPQIDRLFRTYEESLRLDPAQWDVRRKLVAILMRMDRSTDARSHLKLLQEGVESGKPAAELAYLTGVCFYREGKYPESQAAFLTSIREWPQQVVAYLGLTELWTTHADQIVDLTPKTQPDGPAWQDVAQILNPPQKSEAVNGVTAAAAVLTAMQAASPGVDATLAAARFLIALEQKSDRLPLPPEEAEALVRAVFDFETGGHDKDQSRQLEGLERWSPDLPALADANDDGIITRDELKARFERGDRLTRIDRAERLLQDLQSRPEAASRQTDVLLASSGLYSAKAAVVAVLVPTELAATRELARKTIDAGMSLIPPDVRFLLSGVELDLQDLDQSAGQADQLKHLQTAEAKLKAGIADLAKARSEEKPTTVATDEDWKLPSDKVDLQSIEVQARFGLTNLILSQLTLVEPDALATLQANLKTETEALKQAGGSQLLLDYLQVRRLMFEKQYAEAKAIGIKLLDQIKSVPGLVRQVSLLVADSQGRTGNPDAQLDVLRNQVEIDPLWLEGRRAMAESLLAVGRLEEAINEYLPAVVLPGAGERLLELRIVRNANLAPAQRKWDQAEPLLQYLLDRQPPALRTILLAAELRRLQGATAKAIADDEGVENRAEMQQKLLEAERYLKMARETFPQDMGVRVAEVNFASGRFDLPEPERLVLAESLLAAAREDLGADVELDLVDARLQIQRFPTEAGERLTAMARERTGLTTPQRIRLLTGLAQLADRTAASQSARPFWDELSRLEPESLEPRLAIAQLMLAAEGQSGGSMDEAVWDKLLANIEKLEGTSAGNVGYLQALRLLEHPGDEAARPNNFKAAEDLLAAAAKLRPYWSAIPRAQGILAELKSDPVRALERYRQAFALGDRTPAVVLRIGQLLRDKGQQGFDEANQFLQSVGDQNASLITGDVARLASELALRNRQNDRAMELLSKLARDSNSFRDKYAFAVARMSAGDLGPETEALLKDVTTELAPTEPAGWVKLVDYYAQTKNWAAAERTIADASARLPNEPQPKAALTQAVMYELLAAADAERRQQHLTAASKAYEDALKSAAEAGDDTSMLMIAAEHYVRIGSTERAGELLSQLLLPTRAVPDEVRRWARRRQALTVAVGGNYDDTLNSLELLRTAREQGADKSAENLRLQLQLLERLPGVDSQASRVDLLRELQKQGGLTAEEQLQLAELLAAGGDHAGALAEFRSLLSVNSEFARGRAAYIIVLARSAGKDATALDEARNQLDLLRRQEPGSWRTALIHARVLAASGKVEEAAVLVSKFLKQRVEGTSGNPVRDALEQENVAELLYWLQRDQRVRGSASLSAALADAIRLHQAGRRDDAVKSLLESPVEPLLEDLRFEVILQAAALFEEMRLPAAEPLFREYVAKSPRPTAPLQLVGFLIRQNRTTDALALCEQLWETQPKLRVAAAVIQVARTVPTEQRNVFQPWQARFAAEADNPDSPDRRGMETARANLATILGEADASLAALRRSVEANPKDVAALNNLAYVLARRGDDLQTAEKSINEAIDIEGAVPDLVDTRSLVYLAKGQFTEALAVISPLAKPRAPAGIHLRMAECLWKLKRFPEARQALDLARRNGFKLDELLPLDRVPTEEMLRDLDSARK